MSGRSSPAGTPESSGGPLLPGFPETLPSQQCHAAASVSAAVDLYWKEGPPKLQEERTKATGGQPLLPETGKTICYGNSTLQGVALLCEVGGGPFRVSSKTLLTPRPKEEGQQVAGAVLS